jgi:hypothetical protein
MDTAFLTASTNPLHYTWEWPYVTPHICRRNVLTLVVACPRRTSPTGAMNYTPSKVEVVREDAQGGQLMGSDQDCRGHSYEL